MRSNWIILQYANLLVIFNLMSGKGVLKQKRQREYFVTLILIYTSKQNYDRCGG